MTAIVLQPPYSEIIQGRIMAYLCLSESGQVLTSFTELSDLIISIQRKEKATIAPIALASAMPHQGYAEN